jgi:hypothetical protein
MAGEAHEGVVTFEPLTLGREAVLLGKIRVGEVLRLDGGRHQACFRLNLPEASATSWPRQRRRRREAARGDQDQ